MKQSVEQIKERIVNQDIWCNDSMLMDVLFKKDIDGFNWFEDIENLYYTDEELARNYDNIQEAKDNGEDMKEIFEWWRISEWLATKLKNHNEPIIDNDYGYWWGRTTTGQSITIDYVMGLISKDINNQ